MKQSTSSRALWKRSAIALGAGLCIISMSVQAQQSAGSINGRAAKGDVVTVESKSLGISRQITVDTDGLFQVPQLPAGSYRVTVRRASGTTDTTEVSVSSGEGTTATFSGTQRVEITGLVARTIDLKSTESSTILSKAQIDRIPVSKDVTAVTLLAPGATQGDSRLGQTGSRAGNVASLGGASPAENAYYINGFNVTNIVNGVAFNQVPFEAVAEQQVKTGGYGAEFGRSLGGVISVNTKRGTNEWHGGANISYAPMSWRGSSVYARKNASTGGWDLIDREGGTSETKANVWAGGPLIQDKLFAFGLVQLADVNSETYNVTRQEHLRNTEPQYLLKLDWNINKNHLLEFTSFNDKSEDRVTTYVSPVAYDTPKGSNLGVSTFKSGGTNNIVKWTGWLTDDFTLSAMYGVGKYSREAKATPCPIVQDRRTSPILDMGCWTGDGIDSASGAGDTRKAFRLDAEWVLGKHTLKFGLDDETYTSVAGESYVGGTQSYLGAAGTPYSYYRVQNLRAGGTLANGYRNDSGSAMTIIRNRVFVNGAKLVPGMELETQNSAWYIEDSYQVTPNIVASLGLRNESFKNLNPNGESFINVKNTWAPRLGMAWDVSGKGDLKVYANAGRYYIPVYANTNVRLSSPELGYEHYYQWDGTFSNDAYQIPGKGQQLGGKNEFSDGSFPNAKSVVDPNIKPMHQDELILGFQKALANKWSFGMKYTHRKLKDAMDDICDDENSGAWALANGYTQGQADAIAGAVGHCFLYNAGRDLSAQVDLDGTGQLTTVRIPAAALKQPDPKRTYDALEFSIERAWDKQWSLAASYVLAFSKGNTEGYVKSDIGQDDAGISQDFDYPGLMEGSKGYLPNDRRHTIKLWGSYALNDEWRFGGNLLAQSGRPKNCFGFYAGDLDSVSVAYGAASFYCNSQLNPRGSLGRLPWTYDLSLQTTYTPARVKGLTLTMDLLNVLNKRTVRGVIETGEDARNTPAANYQQPILASLQKPRTIRLTAQYDF